jgi:hypothetical protein
MINYKYAVITGILLITIFGGYMALPRGLRNNNPTNIRFNKANNWDGQTGKDSKGFAKFESAHFGIRAGAKLLRNYQSIYNLNTIEDIINRWAPPVENDTGAYIEHVAKVLKTDKTAYLSLLDDNKLIELLQVIIKHENGINPYSYEKINQAVQAAK